MRLRTKSFLLPITASLLIVAFLFPQNTVQAGMSQAGLSSGLFAQADPSPPVISVWYGDTQEFGKLGQPQQWINILGNVSDPDSGVATLTYSLNGGDDQSLSIGPDGRRLWDAGDFNIDIDRADLIDGSNQVEIEATNGAGVPGTKTITVLYDKDSTWPMPYSIDWGAVSKIQDVAQVVDGQWTVGASGLRTLKMGYDRVVVIGDVAWSDYTIQVPITVHKRDNAGAYNDTSGYPSFGIIFRWNGHTDNPPIQTCLQPKCGWWPQGGYAWFEFPTKNNNNGLLYVEADPQENLSPRDETSFQIDFDTSYTFTFRVKTESAGSLYSLQVEGGGQTESLQVLGSPSGEPSGSILLVAHHVDATFGNVTIGQELYKLSTSVNPGGGGTIVKTPNKTVYAKNETVELTAQPASGYRFAGWSGDLSGTEPQKSVLMDRNRSVTASFVKQEGFTLTVNISGGGIVTRSPDKTAYAAGEKVTLTAVPDSGWAFSGWSGALSGSSSPATLTIQGNTTVSAQFAPLDLPVKLFIPAVQSP